MDEKGLLELIVHQLTKLVEAQTEMLAAQTKAFISMEKFFSGEGKRRKK